MRDPSAKQQAKARTMLTEGRVRILAAGPATCTATVEGDTGSYTVTLARGRRRCTCELSEYRPSWTCSHVAAVELVWQSERGNEHGRREDGGQATVRPKRSAV